MKHLPLLLVCIVATTAFGQSKGDRIIAGKQINIPGTKVFINPPAGFVIATNFVGLQKDNTSGIQIYDLVGGNFYTNAATFNKEAFEQKGAEVFEYKDTIVSGYPSKYISMQGDPMTRSFAVVFGDTAFSVMIMAGCPASDKELCNSIRESILSVNYNKNLKVDPLAIAGFTLDEGKSKFKFAKAAASLFIYSVNGANKDSYDDEPILMVTPMPVGAGMTPKSIGNMLISSMEKYGLTGKEVKSEITEGVNGYEAYEAIIYGELNGQQTLNYQLVVVKGGKAVAFQGKAQSEYQSNIDEFRKLAKTIKFK